MTSGNHLESVYFYSIVTIFLSLPSCLIPRICYSIVRKGGGGDLAPFGGERYIISTHTFSTTEVV